MKSFRSAQPLPSDTAPSTAIRYFQSETAEIVDAPEPSGVRRTGFVVGAAFLSVILLSLVTRLDRVVTSVWGQVVTTQPTIVMQALDPSVIKSINVRNGQRVKAGDVLATLDPTFATADVDALKMQIASLDAQVARCEAELAHRAFVPPQSADATATRYGQLQMALYEQRKQQYDDQVNAYNAQMAQTTATIKKLHQDASRYGDRGKLADEVERMRGLLAAAQVGSRLNLLQATDQKTELLRQLEFDQNSLRESEQQLQATTATRNAFTQQWMAQTSQELVQARNQRDSALQQLEKATRHKDLVQLVATEDAVVLQMAKLSVGSVLKEGDPLLYLAPLNSPVEVEARMLTQDVGFVRVGDSVKIKLDAFNYIEHGTAKGTVSWISEGSFSVDDITGQPTAPYYKIRVALTDTDLRNVPPTFRLVPGMTLTADVNVGTRSVLMYMVSGALRGADEAMREP